MPDDERPGGGYEAAPTMTCPGYPDQGHDFKAVATVGALTYMRCRRCRTGPYVNADITLTLDDPS